MTKITKEMITELGNKVVKLCRKNDYIDTSVYYDGKRYRIERVYDEANDKPITTVIVDDDCHPGKYFEYYNNNHILSMAFEGELYSLMNYGNGCEELEKLFAKYGVYYELGNSWNLSVYPNDWNAEVEGYKYEVEPDPIHIWRHKEDNPPELQKIMDAWYEESKKVGDVGSCVVGAGFNFTWNETKYFMSACSPWQGSCSWEKHVPMVQTMLELIGATDVVYKWGILD